MTLCPIALVASCKRCLVVSVCPLKGTIGDYQKAGNADSEPEAEKEQDNSKPTSD